MGNSKNKRSRTSTAQRKRVTKSVPAQPPGHESAIAPSSPKKPKNPPKPRPIKPPVAEQKPKDQERLHAAACALAEMRSKGSDGHRLTSQAASESGALAQPRPNPEPMIHTFK
ncbi:hypothetical protein BV20DRAFT_969602 [Pilatotrama ljubarskyi]|nr:hypothetical protein BV20DRAFT_969602 [Pilatotrama ljubarskyi]